MSYCQTLAEQQEYKVLFAKEQEAFKKGLDELNLTVNEKRRLMCYDPLPYSEYDRLNAKTDGSLAFKWHKSDLIYGACIVNTYGHYLMLHAGGGM